MSVDPKEFENEATEFSLEEETPAPEIENTVEAEKHLRCIRYWKWRLSWAKDHAKAMRDEATAWEKEQCAKIDRHLRWHESGLFVHLIRSGKKTLQLVNGTIRKVTGRESIKEVNAEEFFSWARETDHVNLIRVKQEIDKNEVMKMIKENGEIPPGLDVEVGEDTISITTDK